MASLNQDFTTYQGDYVVPVFTVYDPENVIVDISTVSEITWYVRRDTATAVLLTKTMSGGEISFVTNGSDGKFQVTVDSASTAGLDGFYMHYATITDFSGHITTVTVGRMHVGLKPTWSYNAAAIADVPLYQVRRLIGDVIQNDAQLLDDEILFSISVWSDNYLAAADCCRNISAQYARKIDVTAPGEIRTNYSQQTKNYAARAADLERLAFSRGGGAFVFAGGISIESKESYEADTDRVQPQFNIGMFDNLNAPVPPVGNETPNPGPSGEQ